jgi:GAF domain-containing protein
MEFKISSDIDLSKEECYKLLIAQVNNLIKDEENLIANISNITAILKYSFESFLWVGFYFTDRNKPDELVLGPFQGRVACMRIPFGRGVCGTSAETGETVIVEDVNKFEGHIVCDALSKSEIVIPILKNRNIIGVLDIDSDKINNFDNIDKRYLEKLIDDIRYLF